MINPETDIVFPETLAYITCAGVRVPSNWTLEHLRIALKHRRISFPKATEHDIMAVFGEAIRLKRLLESAIKGLEEEKAKLEVGIHEKQS